MHKFLFILFFNNYKLFLGENPAAMQHGEHSGCISAKYQTEIKYYYLLISMVMVSAFMLLPIPSTILKLSYAIDLLLFLFILLPIIFTLNLFKYVKMIYKTIKIFIIQYFYRYQQIQEKISTIYQ